MKGVTKQSARQGPEAIKRGQNKCQVDKTRVQALKDKAGAQDAADEKLCEGLKQTSYQCCCGSAPA